MNFWDNVENLDAIKSIFGLSLAPVFLFIYRFVTTKLTATRKTKNNNINDYNKIDLKSCSTSVLFSIATLVIYKIYSFSVYGFIEAENIPGYSLALYLLCLLPIPVAVLGAFIGLAIGSRDL